MPVDIEYLKELHELKKAGALNSFEFQKAKDKAMNDPDDEQVGKKKTAFEEADADGDGVVTPEELEAYLAKRAAIDNSTAQTADSLPVGQPVPPIAPVMEREKPGFTINITNANTANNSNTNSGSSEGVAELRCAVCDLDKKRDAFSADQLKKEDEWSRLCKGCEDGAVICSKCTKFKSRDEFDPLKLEESAIKFSSPPEERLTADGTWCKACEHDHGEGWQERLGYKKESMLCQESSAECLMCDGKGERVNSDCFCCLGEEVCGFCMGFGSFTGSTKCDVWVHAKTGVRLDAVPMELLKSARTDCEQQRHADGIQKLTKALEMDPPFKSKYLLLRSLAFEAGKTSCSGDWFLQALDNAEKAVEDAPEFDLAWDQLGDLFLTAGQSMHWTPRTEEAVLGSFKQAAACWMIAIFCGLSRDGALKNLAVITKLQEKFGDAFRMANLAKWDARLHRQICLQQIMGQTRNMMRSRANA